MTARLHEMALVVDESYGEETVEIEIRARPEVVERLRSEGLDLEVAR